MDVRVERPSCVGREARPVRADRDVQLDATYELHSFDAWYAQALGPFGTKGQGEGLFEEFIPLGHWPDGEELPLKQILLQRALPAAREGFERAGIEDTERWLDIIAGRVESGNTGADWITRHWKQFGDRAQLVREYIEQAQTNRPVHQWQDPCT